MKYGPLHANDSHQDDDYCHDNDVASLSNVTMTTSDVSLSSSLKSAISSSLHSSSCIEDGGKSSSELDRRIKNEYTNFLLMSCLFSLNHGAVIAGELEIYINAIYIYLCNIDMLLNDWVLFY